MNAATTEAFAISPHQERAWRFDRGGHLLAGVHAVVDLHGPLNTIDLAQAFDETIRLHEILRTSLIHPEGLEAPIQVIDEPPPSWGFNHTGAPLQVQLERVEAEHHVLTVSIPATHGDEATVHMLLNQVASRYAGELRNGDPVPQYADLVEWQIHCLQSVERSLDNAYWANMASQETPPELPFTRADSRATSSGELRSVPISIEPALFEMLSNVAAQCGAPISDLVQAAWLTLMWRLGGANTLMVLSNGRRHSEVTNLLGPLSKYLPQRYSVTNSTRVSDLLRDVERAGRDARAREEYYAWDHPLQHRIPAFEFLDYSTFPEVTGLSIQARTVAVDIDRFDIRLSILKRQQALSGTIWFNESVFETLDVATISDSFITLLTEMAANPGARLSEISLTSAAEAHRELRWSQGPAPRLSGRQTNSPEKWFEARAAENPRSLAVAWPDGELSYRDLNEQANRLARVLRSYGTGTDVPVAVILGSTHNVPLAFLAALKSGCAYVPLGASSPAERVEKLLTAVGAAIVLADSSTKGLVNAQDAPVIDLDTLDLSNGPSENLNIDVPSEALAYVIYTSGSAGFPKGVMVSRGNLASAILARLEYYGRWPRFALFSPSIFDSSAAGIYGTLCSGGALLMPSEDIRQDTRKSIDFIREYEATHTLMVPSLYSVMLAEPGLKDRPPAALQAVVVAGEECRRDVLTRHTETFPGVSLYNEYGPTEATIWATVARMDDSSVVESNGVLSIGSAIAGVRVLLLDRSLRPVPVGTVGEIFIGGPTVARGYAGSPATSALAFVPDPWHEGARLYRTGDLGRRRPDGSIIFLGRNDEQIKIRGLRIEPGEIEAALRSLEGVNAAAVVAPEENGSRTLVACVETTGARDERALEAALRRSLPSHLVPQRFHLLNTLPRTVTGKIDRRACAALAAEAAKRNDGRAPEGALEIALAGIWCELLHRASVGATEDFFRLGGHSLLAIQLLARIRDRFGCDIRLDQLFEAPTIEATAQAILKAGGRDSGNVPRVALIPDAAARYEPFPLNSIQEAYWVGRKEGFELGNVGSTNYFEFDVPGLDLERFSAALNGLIQRHDMLRATIHADGFQQVAEHVPVYEIQEIDARQMSPEEATQSVERVRAEMSVQSLSTDRWPLFSIVAHVFPSSVRLHISTELVVCDAVSSRILLRDLYRLYKQPGPDPVPLELRFRDYVLAERALRNGPRFDRARAYWLEKLAAMPPAPQLPLAKDPRQITAPHFTTLKHELPEALWSELKRKAAAAGVTPTAVLCAAYASVLSIWTEGTAFTLNLTTYNRIPFHPQVHDLIGDFTSLTLVQIECSAESFTERARRIQHEIWRNLDHVEFSAVDIVRELRRSGGIGSRALLPVVFTSQLGTDDKDHPQARTWIGELVYSTGQAPQVWIDHQVAERLGRLQFWWDYLDELFPPALVEEIFRRYCRFLEELAVNDDRWTRVATESWAEPTVEAAFCSVEDVFPGSVIHSGFLRQALLRPTASAVIWEEAGGFESLTFAGLRLWASQIATWVGDHPVVAILAPKGWAQVAATIGANWAGAAYIPLDVSWPAARVVEVLAQTGCKRIIAGNRVEEQFDLGGDVEWLILDQWLGGKTPEQAAAAWQLSEVASEAGPARPEDLAYVIYTSGSTGKPKGVMMEHRAACLTLAEVARRWHAGPSDRILALSALSFDLSVFDIFGILAAGGCIVMPTESQRKDPAAWLRLCRSQGVTIWNSVPALMEMALEHLDGTEERGWPGPLRVCFLSGDVIATSLPLRFRTRTNALMVSLGGATEAAIWSIAHDITEPDDVIAAWRRVPYGRALAAHTMQVLRGSEEPGTRDLTPCPPGVTGRIYIGGAGLACGYWGNDEETSRRFVINARTGARVYDTGDVGRLLPDGAMEILGRADEQVKIRGHRVELGEIEATLAGHGEVSAAAVKVVETATGSSKQIVAYVVPKHRRRAEATMAAAANGTSRAQTSVPIRPELKQWMDALQFKVDRPGLRQLPEFVNEMALSTVDNEEIQAARHVFRTRRTSRFFDRTKQVTAHQFGAWIECLREHSDGDSYRREYPSAGSMYPVQTYLWAKPEGISGFPGGLYYYDPVRHRIISVAPSLSLARELYDPINRSVFDQSSFAVFLVGKLSAVKPLYDDAARDFCLVEAGGMLQLMMMNATLHSIGVCPIGGLAFDHIREAFGFDADHVLLHSLLGGSPTPPRRPAIAPVKAIVDVRSDEDLGRELLAFSRETLPDYFVPSRFLVVDRLPLSPNGKIDRQQLPEPPPAGEHHAAAPPRTDAEKAVAEMWMKLLGLPGVNTTDDFFALGGDSIICVRFLNRVRERFRVELPLRELFGASTLEKVAASIQRILTESVRDMDDQRVEDLLSNAE